MQSETKTPYGRKGPAGHTEVAPARRGDQDRSQDAGLLPGRGCFSIELLYQLLRNEGSQGAYRPATLQLRQFEFLTE